MMSRRSLRAQKARYGVIVACTFLLLTMPANACHLFEYTAPGLIATLFAKLACAALVGTAMARASNRDGTGWAFFVGVVATALTTIGVETWSLSVLEMSMSPMQRRMVGLGGQYEDWDMTLFLLVVFQVVVNALAVAFLARWFNGRLRAEHETLAHRENAWIDAARELLPRRTLLAGYALLGILWGCYAFDFESRSHYPVLERFGYGVWWATGMFALAVLGPLASLLARTRDERRAALREQWQQPHARVCSAPGDASAVELRVVDGVGPTYRDAGTERVIARESAEWIEDAGIAAAEEGSFPQRARAIG